MVAKTPRLLTAEQRDAFVRIPADLSERDLGRFYTLSARDLEIIGRHRRAANRLGFAVHLGLLRFPGRTLADVPEIPERVVEHIAQQVDVDPALFAQYGERDNTIFERPACCYRAPPVDGQGAGRRLGGTHSTGLHRRKRLAISRSITLFRTAADLDSERAVDPRRR
jgi:hypothetical protein